jgi:hypothetical protein
MVFNTTFPGNAKPFEPEQERAICLLDQIALKLSALQQYALTGHMEQTDRLFIGGVPGINRPAGCREPYAAAFFGKVFLGFIRQQKASVLAGPDDQQFRPLFIYIPDLLQ